jgi:hypothetical protein
MALNYSPQIVTDQLVLALDPGDKNSYPGSGTTWTNLVNSSSNASLINGVSFSTANIGTMVMDGTDDTIYAPSANTLGGLSEQALEIWVRSSGLGPGKYVGGLICPDYGQISYIGGDGNVTYYIYNTDQGYPGTYLFSIGTSGVNIFDNKWHHIICTRGNNNPANIYVDGILKVSSGNTGTWSGTTIWSSMATQIGNNPNDQYYNLLGSIGPTRIYKKYFSQAEVTQNYNSQKSRFGL